jgi:hypothetical protein
MTVWDSALSLRILDGRTGDNTNPWMALIEDNLTNFWRGLLRSEEQTGHDQCQAECRCRIKRFWTAWTSKKIEIKCALRSSDRQCGRNPQLLPKVLCTRRENEFYAGVETSVFFRDECSLRGQKPASVLRICGSQG